MSGNRDELVDRVGSRLDTPKDAEGNDDEGRNDQDARNAGSEGKAHRGDDGGADAGSSNEHDGEGTEGVDGADDRDGRDVENVKQEWNGTTMYLPEVLSSDVGKAYKQLDLQLDDDLTKFQKTRHFYPLLVEAGKERLESMERDEIMERLEGIDPDLETFRPDDS